MHFDNTIGCCKNKSHDSRPNRKFGVSWLAGNLTENLVRRGKAKLVTCRVIWRLDLSCQHFVIVFYAHKVKLSNDLMHWSSDCPHNTHEDTTVSINVVTFCWNHSLLGCRVCMDLVEEWYPASFTRFANFAMNWLPILSSNLLLAVA